MYEVTYIYITSTCIINKVKITPHEIKNAVFLLVTGNARYYVILIHNAYLTFFIQVNHGTRAEQNLDFSWQNYRNTDSQK